MLRHPATVATLTRLRDDVRAYGGNDAAPPPAGRTAIASADVDPFPASSRRLEEWGFLERARLAVGSIAAIGTSGFGLLVLRHEPLPVGSTSAALITVAVALAVIAAQVLIRRLPLFSFPVVLLIVTFVFTCSPLILFALRGDEAFRFWEWVDMASVLAAMPVICLGFSAFLVGSMFLAAPRPGALDVAVPTMGWLDTDALALRRIGLSLYGLSMLTIVGFTLTGGALTHAIAGGYHQFHGAKRAGEISQFAGVSLSRFLPWSLLILAATSSDRRSRRIVILLAVPAIATMLAIGDRSGPVALLVIVATGLFLRGARIGWGRALAVGAFIAVLMPTVLNLRTVPISEWSTDVLRRAATNQMETTSVYRSDLVGGFLLSASSSYQTLMATVKVVPEQEPYHLGSDYVKSLVVAIPFRTALLAPFDLDIRSLTPSEWVLSYLHPGRNAGPGFLQLAEAYLQFGAIGVAGLYVGLGFGLTLLWRYVVRHPTNARAIALSLIVMSETLIWVRNSSALGVRAVVWGWLIVYVAPTVMRSINLGPRPAARRLSLVPAAGR